MDYLDKIAWNQLLVAAASELKTRKDELSAIDSRFGDGDHGVTINKIAICFENAAQQSEAKDLKTFFDELGTAIMGVSGGSAGPLWGTLIGGLGVALNDGEERVDAARVVDMLVSCQAEMFDVTTARVGDKTMMDTLIPAVEAASQALPAATPRVVLLAAAKGAQEGAKATEHFVARYGRAKSYKEQTLGTPDAGAVSLAAFFQALADEAQKKSLL